MSQNNDGLNFHFSYNELINLSFEKEALLSRDITDLTPRGISAARITAFGGLRTSFISIPADATMVANITIAKDERDALAEPLRIAIREVQGIAANAFGSGSAQHKTFLPQALSDLDAGSLYLLAPTIVAQGTTYLAQMTTKGLTAAMLTSITTQANNLKPKITAFELAQGAQLLSTQNRHNAANALYDEMAAMCATAIIYYQDRNKLKAEEYIIYDGGSNSQQRNGSVGSEQTISRAFEAITVDSSFKMKAFEGNDLLMYFSNTESGNPGTASITVINNAVDYKVATAAQLGYNGATGFTHFCIRNSGIMETGYRVVME
jgi:hypothetical protein